MAKLPALDSCKCPAAGFTGIIPLGGLYLTKLIVDAVSAGITSPDKAAALRQMTLYVVLAAIVMLLGALCGSLANLVRQAQS